MLEHLDSVQVKQGEEVELLVDREAELALPVVLTILSEDNNLS